MPSVYLYLSALIHIYGLNRVMADAGLIQKFNVIVGEIISHHDASRAPVGTNEEHGAMNRMVSNRRTPNALKGARFALVPSLWRRVAV